MYNNFFKKKDIYVLGYRIIYNLFINFKYSIINKKYEYCRLKI